MYELLLGRYLDANAIYSDADAIASFLGIEKGGSTPSGVFEVFTADKTQRRKPCRRRRPYFLRRTPVKIAGRGEGRMSEQIVP